MKLLFFLQHCCIYTKLCVCLKQTFSFDFAPIKSNWNAALCPPDCFYLTTAITIIILSTRPKALQTPSDQKSTPWAFRTLECRLSDWAHLGITHSWTKQNGRVEWERNRAASVSQEWREWCSCAHHFLLLCSPTHLAAHLPAQCLQLRRRINVRFVSLPQVFFFFFFFLSVSSYFGNRTKASLLILNFAHSRHALDVLLSYYSSFFFLLLLLHDFITDFVIFCFSMSVLDRLSSLIPQVSSPARQTKTPPSVRLSPPLSLSSPVIKKKPIQITSFDEKGFKKQHSFKQTNADR